MDALTSSSDSAFSLSEWTLCCLFVDNSIAVWLSDITIAHVQIKCSASGLSEDSSASIVVCDGDAAIVRTLSCSGIYRDSDGSLSVLVLDIDVLHQDGSVDDISKNFDCVILGEVG